jgi:mono/diheme cytochrome c family protein
LLEASTGLKIKRMSSQRWSTRTVAISTIAVLIGLDLARSVLGHLSYRIPISIWQPKPEIYADMAWPPSANVPANASKPQRIYLEKCAFCHGPDGRGNGPSAPSMIPRPRDFTQGEFKYKSTPLNEPPTDDDLIRTVRDGLHASGMPYFSDILSAADIRDVVSYIKNFSGVFTPNPFHPIEVAVRPVTDASSIARGEALYRQNGCADCHGADLRGGMWLQDAKGYPVVARDLTAPWTFRGGADPVQVYLRISTGMSPGPMSAFTTLSAENRWDLVNYLESRYRSPPWLTGQLDGPGQSNDLEQRGRYLVHAEMCGLCHTEVDRTLIYRDDRYLAGGMRVGAYPQGTFISRNLTSDAETGLGGWTEAEVAAAIRDGIGKGGRQLNFWGMPWPWLHNMAPMDAIAIARYLKTLPPVHNQIPEPAHFGVAETIAAKIVFGDPMLGRAPILTYDDGSYANQQSLSLPAVGRLLGDAQWIVVIAGVVIFIIARRGSASTRRRSWLRSAGLAAGGLIVLGIGYFINATPTIPGLPSDQVAEGASGDIPRPDLSNTGAVKAALIRRGRTIFAIASCAMCHNNNGSGGLKASWAMGTIFTANITPDPIAGLGAWTDEQIARAIRSGVSRDGRSLYWQGMPWDHFSNFDEEDIASVVAYLRAMPPVRQKVPPNLPPGANDCSVYSFWTVPNEKPGCN